LKISDFAGFTKHIEQIYEEVRGNEGGSVASYIPELAKVDGEKFGISVCSVDG